MHPRSDPRCWIIIAHLKHAASRLDPIPGAPPRYKRAGQRPGLQLGHCDRSSGPLIIVAPAT
jgi:hypothetical protein